MLLQRRIFNLAVDKGVSNYQSYNFQKLIKYVKMSINAPQSGKSIIAISQMCSTNNKSDNMRQVETLCAQAEAQKASFLFLPECCDFIGENRKETLALSEPLNGPTIQKYKELAKKHKIWLSLGGFHESILDGSNAKTDKIYNAHVIVDENGDIVSVYRKLHLFDVETPKFRFRESEVVTPGPRLISPLSTPIGKLGLQICYDLRFGESSLILSKSGAQILTYPSAFAISTGPPHWEVLLRARAIENQCFVIAAAQIGSHNAKRQSWGHAMAVDPWGKVIAECGEQKLAIAPVEIDLSLIDNIKKSMPCFQHRRHDIYTLHAFETNLLEPQEDRFFAQNTICKETIFYESEHCFAFTNLRCVVEGHVLVSTKRVVPRLNGLNSNEISDLFATACKIQRMLETIYGTTSATVTVQDGEHAGQTVPHVHIHIMPRRPGDFGQNDQIYHKLEDKCENQKNRDMQVRIGEAKKYREFLKEQNPICP